MKKQMIRKISALCCLTLAVFMSPAKQMNARAAEVIATVQGNVMKGTNTEILKLDTKEGNMEIKLDGGTDVSDCKVLLPGNQISVSVSHGSDGYLHAVKIVSGLHSDTVSLDTSKSSTVTGTITEKSKDGVLYVETAQGDMEIKLDAATDMNGCTVLVADRTYQITCVRGSDAYMHATAITDALGTSLGNTASTTPSSSLTPAPAGSVGVDTSTVTGTVNKKTTSERLFLNTQYGEMELKLDAVRSVTGCKVLVKGRKVTVTCVRGSDAYMHALDIIGN